MTSFSLAGLGLSLLLSSALIAPSHQFSQDLSAAPGLPPLDTDNGGVVTVYGTIAINKLSSVDVVSSNFYADLYTYFSWRDDRFNAGDDITGAWIVDPEGMNADDSVVDFGGTCAAGAAPGWIKGSVGLAAEPAGKWISCFTRIKSNYDGKFDLHDFPFDSQAVTFSYESYTLDESVVKIVAAATMAAHAIPPRLVVGGGAWDLDNISSETESHRYAAIDGTYSRWTVSINITRIPTYFITKYVLNVVLLVIMAGFGVNMSDLSNRIFLALYCFLGIISWMFVLSSQTPALGYNTRLDDFMQVGFFTIFTMLIYNTLRLFVEKLDLESERSAQKMKLSNIVDVSAMVPERELTRRGTTSEHVLGSIVDNMGSMKCFGFKTLPIWKIDLIYYATTLFAFAIAVGGVLKW